MTAWTIFTDFMLSAVHFIIPTSTGLWVVPENLLKKWQRHFALYSQTHKADPAPFSLENSLSLAYNSGQIIIKEKTAATQIFGRKYYKKEISMKNYLIVFLISMLPLIELRGAIPYAVGFGLPLVPSYIIAIIGNMLPVPFIYLFARKILIWGKDKPVIGKFFTFCLEKGEKGGKKLQEKAGRGLFIALMLFVGIPLPGTGAWTGTLAASLLDMDFKSSILAVMLGVLIASVIMGAASAGLFGAAGAIFS